MHNWTAHLCTRNDVERLETKVAAYAVRDLHKDTAVSVRCALVLAGNSQRHWLHTDQVLLSNSVDAGGADVC